MAKKIRPVVGSTKLPAPKPEGTIAQPVPAAGDRTATLTRKTKETQINVTLNLDGSGQAQIASGIGFFDHMLTAFSRHSAIDLQLECSGDNYIDDHHSVEDIGIVLGQAVAQALGNKAGLRRFGFASVPLDEALTQVSIDLAGRGCFVINGGERLGKSKVGTFDVELFEDFLGAFASANACALHVEIKSGRNLHHIMEATVKAFARALREAVERDPRINGIPSTKGVL